MLAEGKTIGADDLGLQETKEVLNLDIKEAREAAERKVIQSALDMNNYNMSRTAETLGVSRPSLYNLMKKLGMSTSDDERHE